MVGKESYRNGGAAVVALGRIIHLVFRGRWSPLRRYQDAIFICVILTGFTGYSMFNPDGLINAHSIFNTVPAGERGVAGAICIFLCLYAFLRGKEKVDAAIANVAVGPALRLYDAWHQHAPVGYVIYGLVFVLAALRILERIVLAPDDDERRRQVVLLGQKVSKDLTTEHVRHEKSMAAQTIAQGVIAASQTEERRVDTASRESDALHREETTARAEKAVDRAEAAVDRLENSHGQNGVDGGP